MTWKLVFLDKAIEDFNKLSGNQKIQVDKIIKRDNEVYDEASKRLTEL